MAFGVITLGIKMPSMQTLSIIPLRTETTELNNTAYKNCLGTSAQNKTLSTMTNARLT
jgi:hypothetical protein